MSNALSKIEVLKQTLTSTEVQNELVKNFTPQQAKIFTNNALQLFTHNESLQKCTVDSIRQAVITSAQYGLPLNKEMGLAYVLPYGNTATFMPSYRGLIQIAMRSNLYKKIVAMPVYESDLALNDDQLLKILFSLTQHRDIRGNIKGILAGALTLDNQAVTQYMDINEIIHIRNTYARGHAKPDSAWSKEFLTMAQKTVLKKLLKTEVLPHAFFNGVVIDLPAESDDVAYTQSSPIHEAVYEEVSQTSPTDVSNDPERFERMLESICAGKYTFEQAWECVVMSDEQKARLKELYTELGGQMPNTQASEPAHDEQVMGDVNPNIGQNQAQNQASA